MYILSEFFRISPLFAFLFHNIQNLFHHSRLTARFPFYLSILYFQPPIFFIGRIQRKIRVQPNFDIPILINTQHLFSDTEFSKFLVQLFIPDQDLLQSV